MKRISLILLFIAILNGINMKAEQSDITIPVVKENKDDTGNPNPKGNRVPSAKIYCTISYTNDSVSTSVSLGILSYQIWDEEGIINIASFNDEKNFVNYLANSTGGYKIKLIAEESIYFGYLYK